MEEHDLAEYGDQHAMADADFKGRNSDPYVIKLSEIEKKLGHVYDVGFGNTIHITINGEAYELVDDRKPHKAKL